MVTISGDDWQKQGESGPGNGGYAGDWRVQTLAPSGGDRSRDITLKEWTTVYTDKDYNTAVQKFDAAVKAEPTSQHRVVDDADKAAKSYTPEKQDNYDVQTSPNSSGLVWYTLDTLHDEASARVSYDKLLAAKPAGFFQILKNGEIIETNLPVEDRWRPTEDVSGPTITTPAPTPTPSVPVAIDDIAGAILLTAVVLGAIGGAMWLYKEGDL